MKIMEVKRDDSDLEKELAIIQIRIKRTLSLPIDNLGEPGGTETDPTLYPPIELRELEPEDLIPKLCRKRKKYFGDPIIDSLPSVDEPDPDLCNWPQQDKDHYRSIVEIKDQYPELVKNGECDIPDCICHWVASLKKKPEGESKK